MIRHFFKFDHSDVDFKAATKHARLMEIAEKFETFVKAKQVLSVDSLPAIPLFIYPNTFYKLPREIQKVYKQDTKSKLYYLLAESDMGVAKVADDCRVHTVRVIW